MASDGAKKWNNTWWADRKKEKTTALPSIKYETRKPKKKKA
jgi:hypothetical protein